MLGGRFYMQNIIPPFACLLGAFTGVQGKTLIKSCQHYPLVEIVRQTVLESMHQLQMWVLSALYFEKDNHFHIVGVVHFMVPYFL